MYRDQQHLRLRSLLHGATAAILILLGVGCEANPSPDQLKKTLVDHPDVLIAAVEAHPAEFLDVLNRAAARNEAAVKVNAARRDSAQREADFSNPKRPRIDHRAALGNPNAPVTIVEYSDFQCPYCMRERAVLYDVMRQYGERVRLVIKHTPVPNHPEAMPAALMYEAIARQSPIAAFRFYDDLFSHQEALSQYGQRFIDSAAARTGIDFSKAKAAAASAVTQHVIDADMAESQAFGFTGTPGLLINGVALQGEQSLAELKKIIDRHLAAQNDKPSGYRQP